MIPGPDSPDLPAMAQQAEVEILAAEALVVARSTVGEGTDADADAASSFATAELGYYEAELRSLRSAATGLDAAERAPGLP